jgi:hypothetical protein
VIDRGDQELGLRRDVVKQGAARDVGSPLDLERRGASEPDLDQTLDDGVEQRATGLVATLLLRARNANRLIQLGGVPPKKQSVKTVCKFRLTTSGRTSGHAAIGSGPMRQPGTSDALEQTRRNVRRSAGSTGSC